MSTTTTTDQNSTGHLAEYASSETTVKRAQWEDFELAPCPGASQINVCNRSYAKAEQREHTYTVTIENRMPVACTCKAFEYNDGLCKHCLACAADEEVLEIAESGHSETCEHGDERCPGADRILFIDLDEHPDLDERDSFPCLDCYLDARQQFKAEIAV